METEVRKLEQARNEQEVHVIDWKVLGSAKRSSTVIGPSQRFVFHYHA